MFAPLCVVQVAAAVDRGSPDFMTGLRVSRRELQLSAGTQGRPLAGTRALPGREGARRDHPQDALVEHGPLRHRHRHPDQLLVFWCAHARSPAHRARARDAHARACAVRSPFECGASPSRAGRRLGALPSGWRRLAGHRWPWAATRRPERPRRPKKVARSRVAMAGGGSQASVSPERDVRAAGVALGAPHVRPGRYISF